MQYKISLTESFRNTLNRLDSILQESNREKVDEYLTPDEKAQVDQWEKRTPQATKATDPYFGVGNDEINEPLIGGKSDIHRAIEKDIGIEIPPESYKSGIVKDKSGKQQRIGTLISEPSLRNAYKTDNTRKNVKTNDLSVTTSRSPHGVAGQTSHGQSWEQASCKNFNDGSNRHYLCQEVQHGTVVVYLKDKDGTELARGTLQPYINKQGVYQYRLNGFYGDKNPMFIKYIKHLERKLSHEHAGDERYDIHPDVYDDNRRGYTFPYEGKAIKDAVSKDWRALKNVPEDILRQHPEIYEIAVSQDWKALCYIPTEVAQQHPKLYKIAVRKNPSILRDMNEDFNIRYFKSNQFITPGLCKIAVSQDGNALMWVPEELRTPELCKIAVSQNGWALGDVPPEVLQQHPELEEIANQNM